MYIDQHYFLNSNIFIISGGKTGTQSLESSFKRCMRAHSEVNFQSIQEVRKLKRKITLNQLYNFSYFKYQRKPLIISSFREPMSRTISSFFEQVDLLVPDHQKMSVSQLITIFNERYLLTLEDYHPQFSPDVNGGFDLNDPIYHFDKDKKCSLFENENAFLFLLRFDEIDQWNQLITDNLPSTYLKDYKINCTNISYNKTYYTKYKDFINEYHVEEHKLNKKYEDNITQLKYYYDETKIIKIKNFWYQKVTNG